ncbi:MAG: dihydropteroate synthase [Bacteroidales bacterium]|nr:dihydropteroate synthase [Bacteroidales bacterium]
MEAMQKSININGKFLPLDPPLIMGILNVTEDSFFDGGRYLTEEAVVDRVGGMLASGADIIDIGAVSTRPGAQDLPEQEEIDRIRRAVTLVHGRFPDAVISVDTWRASVARAAVQCGAHIINDVSGGTFDPDMIPTIGQLQVPYILMHTPEKPDTMQQHTDYEDILAEMIQFFGQQIEKLHEAHVHDIILDPGFGFGKTLEQNYFVLKNMDAFQVFDLPILVGISRKSMIYKLLGTTPDNALNGTTVVNTLALMKGAHILRVHDVKEAVEVRKIVEIFRKSKGNTVS